MPEQNITVNIANRPYRLKINRDEEENVRKALKILEEKINKYAEVYAYKDKQDLLAMVALQFATIANSYEENARINDTTIISKLQDIDYYLTDYLSNK